jgi:hypothetical protein
LKPAGLEAYVSPGEVGEINALLEYASRTDEIKSTLEMIRKFLAAGLETGNIKLAPMADIGEAGKSELANHPSMSVFRPPKEVGAIITDDRAMNKAWNFDTGAGQIPVFTTLDLLDTLQSKGHISLDELFENKTKLRRAGYIFIPITQPELEHYLSATLMDGKRLVESAELKAIRENLLKIRMGNSLQLATETRWFAEIMNTLTNAIIAQWHPQNDVAIAQARSNWLLQLLDTRGWAQFAEVDHGLGMIEVGYGGNVIFLFVAAMTMHQASREHYFKWLEASLISTLRHENPDLYLKIVAKMQEMISDLDKPNMAMESK